MSIKATLLNQLKQGASPRELALGVAVGFTWGLFPILGTTTLGCLLTGHWLKLNHPTLQTVNYLMAPVQLLMIPLWVRLGEFMVGAAPVALSPSGLVTEFKAEPSLFFVRYGQAGLQGTLAWLCLGPLAGFVAFWILKPVFERVGRAAAIAP